MKIYNTTTKELFGVFNFENPNIFKSFKIDTKIKLTKYCYIFPQRVHTYNEKYKENTVYFFLFWRIIINHKYPYFI